MPIMDQHIELPSILARPDGLLILFDQNIGPFPILQKQSHLLPALRRVTLPFVSLVEAATGQARLLLAAVEAATGQARLLLAAVEAAAGQA